jgi:hypothetical protein
VGAECRVKGQRSRELLFLGSKVSSRVQQPWSACCHVNQMPFRFSPLHVVALLFSSEEYNPYTTWAEDSKHNQVLVIMATNRPESLDPKLRRPGFTDRELVIGLPGPDVRIDIFNVSIQSLSCREPSLRILMGKTSQGLQLFTNQAPEDNRTSRSSK